MKKKNIILIILSIILVIGVICFIVLKNNNKIVSTITLDINPSVEINLDKDDKVISVVALNDDAKKIVNSNLKGKSLTDIFEMLISNLIEKGYVDEDKNLDVILHVDGNIEDKTVSEQLEYEFGKKDVHSEIVIIENVTKEDKELAKKYNVSPAKVSYIKSITDDNENINIEDLTDKSVDELVETKQTGKYCDPGYTLEGDFCIKELRREPLTDGKVCPKGYFEFDNECYEEAEGTVTDKLVCNINWVLEDGKCYYRETIDAIAVKTECTKGEEKTKGEVGLENKEGTDSNEKVCVDLSKASHPVSPCELNDGTEHTKANGKCYWHRAPIISTGCPGKIKVNGYCWDDASNVLICKGARDGKQYKSRNEYCEGSVKILKPTVVEYGCENDFVLEGNKCKREIVGETHNEKLCPSGFTLLDSGQCINKKKSTNKTDGKYCANPNSKVKNNECVIYDIVEAKQ